MKPPASAEAISAPDLSAAKGVRHGFFTRRGGVSEGIFTTLNCGLASGDDRAKVMENLGRSGRRLGVELSNLVTAYQIHSADVVTVERPWAPTGRPRADAMVTRTPGIALGVLAADCGPVLFADAEARVIGAAHAGWRGALGGVLQATVDEMETLGARRADIAAALGPCIGPSSYEVGPEFPAPFLSQDPANKTYFRPARREGRFMFDLARYIAETLGAMGLGSVHATGHDTCADEDIFFSYRRSRLREEGGYGRNISAIVLGS